MSMLRSALEEIQGRDPDRLDEAGLEEGYAELERAADVVLSERLRWLAAIERRGIYARDGHLDPPQKEQVQEYRCITVGCPTSKPVHAPGASVTKMLPGAWGIIKQLRASSR
jgi:hypothetical protein